MIVARKMENGASNKEKRPLSARGARIIQEMLAKTAELTAPIRQRIEEQTKLAQVKDVRVAVLLEIPRPYIILAARVPMRGTRYINRGA